MGNKKSTKRFYDITSNSYDELYGDEQRGKYRFVFEIAKEVKGNVLDVGCGSGLFEQEFEMANDRLILAVDFSIKLLEKAKQRLARRPDIDLICADAEWLPFQEKIFNFGFSFTVFHNLENINRGVNELRRVFNKNGIFMFTYLKEIATRKILKLFGNSEVFDFKELKEYIIKTKL